MNGSTRRRDMMGVFDCVSFFVSGFLFTTTNKLVRQQCRILSSSCLVWLQERFCTKYGILCISLLVVLIVCKRGEGGVGEEKGSLVSVRGASEP
jgi:hypothetical protein